MPTPSDPMDRFKQIIVGLKELQTDIAQLSAPTVPTLPFRAQYMTYASRKTQTWLDGPEFPDLERAQLYCAIIRALGPDVQHTQVLDDAGERVFFVDNEWAAIYDLVFWAKLDNPEAVADQIEKLFNKRNR